MATIEYYVKTWSPESGTKSSTLDLEGLRAEAAACRSLGGSIEVSRPEWDEGSIWSSYDQSSYGGRGWEGRPFHPQAVQIAAELGWRKA